MEYGISTNRLFIHLEPSGEVLDDRSPYSIMITLSTDEEHAILETAVLNSIFGWCSEKKCKLQMSAMYRGHDRRLTGIRIYTVPGGK